MIFFCAFADFGLDELLKKVVAKPEALFGLFMAQEFTRLRR